MKILLITDGIYPFVMGGMQKHSYYLAKFLGKKGVGVTVVHCRENDNEDEKKMAEFADFDQSNLDFKSYPFPSLDSRPGHYVRENKKYSENIYADLKGDMDQYDLIYCQGFAGWKFITESKKGVINIPIVTNLHGYEMFQKAPSFRVRIEHQLVRKIATEVSKDSDYVFSFGGQITKILKKIGLTDKQIVESPIGIESTWLNEDLKPSENNVRRFVFVGRNERRKGIIELSATIRELNKENKVPYEFHFIGEIDEQEQVKADNVIYHGRINGEQKIQEILQSCDILFVASYSEGMPTVIMEAMASGLAIIGTDVGAIERQIDNNGWLLPNSKVSTLKAAIEKAVAVDQTELMKLKNNSLAKVKEKYMWDKVIDHKIKCFEAMIAEKKK